MKCVQNLKGEIRRVSDREALEMLKSGNWQYVPKKAWKASKKKAS